MMSKIAVNHSVLQKSSLLSNSSWCGQSLERFTLTISSSPAVLFLATMSPLSLYEMKQLFAASKAILHYRKQETPKVEEMVETEFKAFGQTYQSFSHFPYKMKYFCCDC